MYIENIIRRIESVVTKVPKSEQKVARYIIEYPETVPKMTINELADKSGASRSAVTRFCRSIDVDNFAELKIALSALLSNPSAKGYSDVLPNEPIDSIKEKIMYNALETIKETVHYIKTEQVVQIVDCLEKTDRLLIYGLGASRLVCEDIAQKWNRVGKTSLCMTDRHSAATVLATSSKNTVFIVVSNKGETKEVIGLIHIAKQYGIEVISITQYGQNTISQLADYSLQHIIAPESEIRSAATHSLYAQFLTVNILFFSYISKNFEDSSEKIESSRNAVRVLDEN